MRIESPDRFAILQGLTPEGSDTLLARSQLVAVKRGAKVIEAGKPAASLFLVRSGRIELRFNVVYYNASVEVPLESIGVGALLGWSALIPPHHYTLSGYATEDSELLQVQRTDLQDCCEADPALGYRVMKNLARIVGERYEVARHLLVGEIQRDLKKKEDHSLWKAD